MADAVKRPTYVSLQASIDRVDLIDRCGAFDLALDAAETIKADNAIEQMLVHQMAAAHKMCLRLMEKAFNEKHNIEVTRLVSTSARLMDVYSKAMLTLNKIRTGGQQIVTVQHVNVNDGGQAVINASVRAHGRVREGNPRDEDKK
jgi:lipoate synthase